MIKKSIIESSDEGRNEIIYSSLTPCDLDRRIKFYEQKYGMPFARCKKQFSCDQGLPWEGIDYMVWDNLVQERAARERAARKHSSFKS